MSFIVFSPEVRSVSRLTLIGFCFCFGVAVAPAQGETSPSSSEQAREVTEDELKQKSQYHLFNPTPRRLMREMSTDRPDKTESPYTVDAGHYQIEMDLISYVRDRVNEKGNNTTSEGFAIAPINLKAGLTNSIDLQLVFESYLIQRVRDHDLRTDDRISGVGDVTARMKFNIWGNDGGRTAFGVMPFIKFPTNENELGNDSYEGGIILPLAVQLPYGWAMGVMAEFDLNQDADDRGRHTEFIQSITFGHDIIGDLAGYVEFYSNISTEKDADWVATVDFGLTYGLTENIQLDAGVNIGVTEAADDCNPFVGVSVRF